MVKSDSTITVMKTPRSVDIAITGKCNLRCDYCSHFSGAGDVSTDLSTEAWLDFFGELNRCAVMDVTLQGGEPFCRTDFEELIDGIVRNRMRFSILTNGTLITRELAAFLADTGRCDGVQVSIDGAIPITHDAFRGKGNFRRAIDGIRHLQRRKVPVSVRVTIHKKNVYELGSIAKLLIEDIGLAGFSTNAASFMGLCRQNSEMVQLSTEERTHAMASLLKLNKRYNDRIAASAGPLAEARIWRSMIKNSRSDARSVNAGGCLSACNGIFDTLAVRSDGVMVPCIQLSHLELGRINQDDLQQVWQDHPELGRLRNRQNLSLSSFEFCEGCAFIQACTGNCPALAYLLLGKENHPSPDACLKRFLEAGGKLPKASI